MVRAAAAAAADETIYTQKDTTSGRLGVRANLQRERFPRSAKDKWLLRALNN